MKRVQYLRYGGPEVLRLDEVETEAPRRGQIRIKVHAASANPMDWKIRRGELKMMTGSRFPRGLGHDFSGVVEAIGPEVRRLKVGDEVFGGSGLREAGTFAETLVTEEKNAILKPRSVTFEQAACLTIVGITAWNALIERAGLKSGQSVFISGCLGGVGRAAVQLARFRGAEISGSCSASTREEALALGVSEVVDYRTFDPGLYRARFDVVFDTAGSLSLGQCGGMLKPKGLALHIVPTPAKMIAGFVSPRHKTVFGVPTPECMAGIATAAEDGVLVPEIGRTAALSEAVQALIELETAGTPKGKLVIVPV